MHIWAAPSNSVKAASRSVQSVGATAARLFLVAARSVTRPEMREEAAARLAKLAVTVMMAAAVAARAVVSAATCQVLYVQ